MMDSREFAAGLVRRSYTLAEGLVDDIYDQISGPLQGESLVGFLHTFMWREYMLGCHAPAKELTMLPDSDMDLKLRLSAQFVDEWNHSMVFSQRARAHGGHGDAARHEPSDEDWALYQATVDFDNVIGIAASLHCSGEIVVQTALRRMCEPLNGSPKLPPEEVDMIKKQVLDDDVPGYRFGAAVDDQTVLQVMKTVIPDEGRHVRTGRAILERYATTPEAQEKAERAVERKFETLFSAHRRSIRDVQEKVG